MLNIVRILLACVIGLTIWTVPAMAKNLSMLSSFPETLIFSREIAVPFVKKVQELSGDSIKVKVVGPEAVGPFEQLQPVQAGAFDLLFTHPNYHIGTIGIGESIEGINSDPVKRRKLGLFDFIDKQYQRMGLKLLALPSTGTKGVRIFLKKPVTSDPSFKGRVIRSAPAGQPMVKALGGSPVTMPGGQVYTALQRGAIDGVIWPQLGAKDLKWYEVSDYYIDPAFGTVGFIFLMNLKSWNSLTPEQQKNLAAAGESLELECISRFDAMIGAEYKFLREKGMKPTHFSPSDEKRAEALWEDGVWKVVIKNSGKIAEEFRKMAREKGMTK